MPTDEVEDLGKVKALAQPKLELGGTGTLITGGFISDQDYSAELVGLQGIEVYEKMRNDATVRASLWAMKLPLLAATWYVHPAAEDDKKATMHKEFIEEELFYGTSHTWEEFLRNVFNYLDFGHYVFEIVYKLRPDGKIGWRKFAPRLPKTIQAWETKDGQPGIRQWTLDKAESNIPMEKLLVFVNEKEGDNWYGRSLLRSSYRNWYTKDALYQIEAMALERQGIGIPYVKVPKGASPADEAASVEYLRNLRANEEGYLKWKEDWEFGFLQMGAGSRLDPSKTIEHHDRQILKNVLAQFLQLGSGETGSFALSKDQSQLFILSLQYVATYVAAVISQYAIRRLIDINFGVQEAYPELRVTKIGQTDYSGLATATKTLIDAGIITPEEGLEVYFRDAMTLPEMPAALRAEMEFEKFMQQMSDDEMALDQREAEIDAMEGELAMEEDEEPEELEEETVEASETFRNVLSTVFAGSIGTPLSAEHRAKISEALKRYWATRKKNTPYTGLRKKKGRMGGGGKAKKVSEAEKAMKKEKATKVKALRSKRKTTVKNLRTSFRKQKFAARRKIMERKAKGDMPSKEDYAKMQLDLLKSEEAMLDKIDKIDTDTDKQIDTITASESVHMPSVLKLKEEVDNAISKLKTVTGTD